MTLTPERPPSPTAVSVAAALLRTAAFAWATAVSATAAALPAPQTVDHGLFSGVQVYRPTVPIQQFVEWLATGDGLSADDQPRVQSMLSAGAMVAVVPWGPFYRKLVAQDGKCTYGGGAFENLSRHVQAFDKLPTYLVPMIAGSGRGAALAYALLAQAPAGTFASALSVGFCPRLVQNTPLCAANALHWQTSGDGGAAGSGGSGGSSSFDLQPAGPLVAPWSVLGFASGPVGGPPATAPAGALPACTPAAAQAFVQQVPQAVWAGTTTAAAATPGASATAATAAADDATVFEKAYARLATRQVSLGPPPAQLADLPIVELPVSGGSGKRFAVMLSGDGGWAGIDKGLGAAFVAQGIPVAGFDSLRYFWSARTPDGLATDLDRIIRYYAARWKRSEVVLIGYSQGADVLPFAINRLPPGSRASVRSVVLLGPGQKASFEFHVTHWIGPSGDRPIAPEAKKLLAANTLCVYGADERDSLCPELNPRHARPMPLSGGHHFGGDYEALAARILDTLGR